MHHLKTMTALQDYVATMKKAGKTIGLVPTMGALHEGHMALVRTACEQTDVCMPYIFLNPTQFAPHEDFDSYPRTLEKDMEMLRAAGAQAVWTPSVKDIYPNGPEIDVKAPEIGEVLEGEFRPHFFDGVVTVLARMFRLSEPDKVFMGEKDYQQLQVVTQMVRQENIPTKIIGVPTERDKNGLALSSRNAYLNPLEYEIAIHMNKILREMKARYLNKEVLSAVETWGQEALLEAGFEDVDYIVIRDSKTLRKKIVNKPRYLAAAWLGKTRLIDNLS